MPLINEDARLANNGLYIDGLGPKWELELVCGLIRGRPEYGRSLVVEQVEFGAEAGVFLFEVVALRLDEGEVLLSGIQLSI